MFTKNRYDILLGRPGQEVVEKPKLKPPDISFLSDNDFLDFMQKEIKRREEGNNTVFITQLAGVTGIGVFINREQAEANRLGRYGYAGVTGISDYRGYAGVTAMQGSTNTQDRI
jgi:hypothetical protein